MYYEKYIKYKTKYLKLRRQQRGGSAQFSSVVSDLDEFQKSSLLFSKELGEIISRKNISYDDANAICGEKRQEMIRQTNREDQDLFGKIRLIEGNHRQFTQMGTDPYLRWREPVIKIFKKFFSQASKDGRGQIAEENGEFTKVYTILSLNLTDPRNTIKQLPKHLDLGTDALAHPIIKQLLMSFPKMEIFPEVKNVSIVLVSFLYKKHEIGTYIMAVETAGTSNNEKLYFKQKAENALIMLEHLVEGGACGLLYLHPNVEVGLYLKSEAKETYDRIISKDYDTTSLLQDLGKLRWLKSHAQEFIRGTPTIAEWFGRALAYVHGFELKRSDYWIDQKYENRDLADTFALSMSLDKFVAEYELNTELTKLVV